MWMHAVQILAELWKHSTTGRFLESPTCSFESNLPINIINTLTSGLIQAVRKKTAGSHVALHGDISAPVSVTDLFEVSKDAGSLGVCIRSKNSLVGECGFFVSDVISGGLFGQLHLALGANR